MSRTNLDGHWNQDDIAIGYAPKGDVHKVAAGSTTTVFVNTTFDGTTGSSAYTIGDIVAALKKLGVLAA